MTRFGKITTNYPEKKDDNSKETQIYKLSL
jgi:hypothetical protein